MINLKKNNGFTLLEMSVVVALLAILVGMVFPNIGTITNTARDVVNSLNQQSEHQSNIMDSALEGDSITVDDVDGIGVRIKPLQYGDIIGSVSNATSETPAAVDLTGEEGFIETLNTEHSFSFEDLSVSEGYILDFSIADYDNFEFSDKTVNVFLDEEVRDLGEITVEVTEHFDSLEVNVPESDSNNQAIVELVFGEETINSVTTDGNHIFEDIPAIDGEYIVNVELDGYRSESKSVEIQNFNFVKSPLIFELEEPNPFGEIIYSLDDDDDRISSVSISPDGNRVARASGVFVGTNTSTDRKIRILDTTNFDTVLTYDKHIDEIRTVEFSPDGNKVASVEGGSRNGDVHLWDANTGHKLFKYGGHLGTTTLRDVTFSSDGSKVITSAYNGTSHVIDVSTGQKILEYKMDSTGYGTFVVPDSNKAISYGGSTTLEMWDINSGKTIRTFEIPKNENSSPYILHVSMSPDKTKLVVSAGDDNRVHILDFETNEVLLTYDKHGWDLQQAEFTRCGNKVISNTRNGSPDSFHSTQIHLWDPETGEKIDDMHPRDAGYWVHGFDMSPDGSWIIPAVGSDLNTNIISTGF